jgi:hypothetical protein
MTRTRSSRRWNATELSEGESGKTLSWLLGHPPLRQKKGAKMGHGAVGRMDRKNTKGVELASGSPTLAPEKRRKDGARSCWSDGQEKHEGSGVGFWVTHLCARKKAQRWGTELLVGWTGKTRREWSWLLGHPPLRQKKGAKMGHGAVGRMDRKNTKGVELASGSPTLAPEKRRKDGARSCWSDGQEKHEGSGVGFWVTHPCARKKAQRWGTGLLVMGRKTPASGDGRRAGRSAWRGRWR